ncbi:hypothetical protein [Scleromatobacter humisilvae]|uniref:Lipoprotein n=1 Tax=Scleromatobacter humisilvae TaxID=2897159 RepID=A0A9X1YPJ9_9BURK|nr:hypothetical protein [Scleromatobacter humisilvae]MCK9688282.1 hypothetical protein [Scleromatobacter humisilvae]
MKSCLALLAASACLRAAAMPPCPVDGFYPATNPRLYIEAAVADPKPTIGRNDEELWFDFIEVDGRSEPGWQPVYDVALLRGDQGRFRIALLRAKSSAQLNGPGPGVVDSRDLPPALAERIHRGVTPILARTHYPAELVDKKRGAGRTACTDGSWIYATVSALDGQFDELVGEARPGSKDSDAGAVLALGQALRDYALHRIDEDALEAPLKLVESHARPDNEHER